MNAGNYCAFRHIMWVAKNVHPVLLRPAQDAIFFPGPVFYHYIIPKGLNMNSTA
jgi:hypothetical protein